MSNQPQILHKTAILQKAGLTASISIYSCEGHVHSVASFDPRYGEGKQHHRQAFETRTAAITQFDEHLAISRDRGWTVVFNGTPNNAIAS